MIEPFFAILNQYNNHKSIDRSEVKHYLGRNNDRTLHLQYSALISDKIRVDQLDNLSFHQYFYSQFFFHKLHFLLLLVFGNERNLTNILGNIIHKFSAFSKFCPQAVVFVLNCTRGLQKFQKQFHGHFVYLRAMQVKTAG